MLEGQQARQFVVASHLVFRGDVAEPVGGIAGDGCVVSQLAGIGSRYFRGSRPVAVGILGGFGAVPGLPGPFAPLARQVAGEITGVTDCSWPRDGSAVWRLTSASGGCWYLKRHSSDRFHTREVAALQDWAQALGPDRAPELAAADPELLIMVITAVPGQPVLELQLGAREEREVHRQAGLLLGRLHESTQAAGPAPTSAA